MIYYARLRTSNVGSLKMLLVYSKLLIVVVLLLVEWKLSQSACIVTVSHPPWPMPYVLVPENSTTIINCAYEGITQPYFQVDITNTTFADVRFSDEHGQRDLLSNYGLYEISDSPSAVIEINNTNVNNGTLIECRYLGKLRPEEIELRVYEPTAIGLDIADVDLSVVNISWSGLSAVNHLDVIQNSTLTITYGSNSKVINTTEHHYSFNASGDAPPCEVYNFSVTATYVGAIYTGAGCSVPSQVLSRMLPSLPDIEGLNSSLKYFLLFNYGDLKLNLSFECGKCCEDYPVLNYTLEVRSSSSEVVIHSITPQHHNLIGNLSENREYSFKIVVVNAFGNISSSIRQFNTADVQLVTANFNESSKMFSVQCDFIPGSDAQGCMVVLVGELDNTTVNLTRLDTVAVEMINVTCPPKNYIQVIGYDIESDNKSIGPLAIHGKLLFNDSELCPLISHEIGSSLSITTILAITIPTTFIIISISIIMIVLLVKRSNTRVFRLSPQPTLGCTNLLSPSQPEQDKEQPEAKEPQQIMPLYELPKKSNVYEPKVADEDVAEDTLHSTSKCGGNNIVMITENITTYAEITEKDPEHFYHTLENAKMAIGPDPDAPELPPPFKPETTPPPIYQDILDLRSNKGHTTLQNEYSTISI